MPARDYYHDVVKKALVRDGWTITHDPLSLKWGVKDLFVDLGAERLLAAEKRDRKIAVEIKSFLGRSEIEDLRNALGQYTMYRKIMEKLGSGRELFLAVNLPIFLGVFAESVGKLLVDEGLLMLVVFDSQKEEVVKWIP